MRIDCHVHVACVSQASGGRTALGGIPGMAFALFERRLGLHRIRDPEEREAAFGELLADRVARSELDRAVILAVDRVHRPDGTPDDGRTRLHVPNRFVRELSARHPERFLWGASIHPARSDALDELDRAADEGAALVKWIPNSQGIDPAAPAHRPFLRRLAERGLPLLSHTGYEHAVAPLDQSLGDPARLRPALEEGVTVIAAHAAGAGRGHRRETFGAFLGMLAAHPNLYADTAALVSFWRSRYLEALLDPGLAARRFGAGSEGALDRLVHGSDHPVPGNLIGLRGRLSRDERRRLGGVTNPLQWDVEAKRALGLPDECLTRLAALLPPRALAQRTPAMIIR